MNQAIHVQKSSMEKQAREQLKLQLGQHLEGQPESTRMAHKWMKRVDAAGLGIGVAMFAMALYGSFTWASANPTMIPLAWFGFATCLSMMTVLLGLHAILIRAFPPVILPGKPQKFVSGATGVWAGVASIAGGLILAGFWIALAYSTATFNLAMLVPLMNIFGVAVSIGIVASIIFSIYWKVSRSR